MKLVRIDDPTSWLDSLDQAKTYLAACKNFDDAKMMRDKASAMAVFARAQKDAKHIEIGAGEIRLLATVRMGELLPPKMTRQETGEVGGRGNKKVSKASTPFSGDAAPDVSRDERRVARAVAAVPKAVREEYVESAKANEEAPTVTGLIRAGRVAVREVEAEARKAAVETPNHRPLTTKDLGSLAAAGKRFATIYADPPWAYSNQGTTGTMANHYAGMSLADICAMPVESLAAENAHLHLWSTSPLLPEAFEVMRAWGFAYKSSMIWIKTGRIGMGNYWRVNHEILLLGVRGKLPFPQDEHGIRSHVDCAPSGHSVKPDAFRGLIERVSPGPRLELFGRDSGAASPGWVVWGNQANPTLFAKEIGPK